MIRHIGIRPMYELTLANWKRQLWWEELPNGKIRVWTMRMLRSGCNNVMRERQILTTDITGEELYYCKNCDEYFAKEQWEET